MKAIVVGMGVQGIKRKKSLRNDFICSVDNFKKSNLLLNKLVLITLINFLSITLNMSFILQTRLKTKYNFRTFKCGSYK